jgi:hypothetical protein
MREDVENRRSRRQQEQLQPTILVEKGYPASYTCMGSDISEGAGADTDATTTTKTLQFQFDYEFVMRNPREDLVEVFYEDLPVLEYGILLMAVQAIGLDTCKLDGQNISQWSEESHVVSLASSRADVLDRTVGTLRYIPTERSADDSYCMLLVLLTCL